MYGMLTTENNQTRDKIFAMTPEIGSSFWPQSSTIEDLCKGMLNLNITAAKMIGNYASLKDFTNNFISTSTFQTEFSLQRLGIVDEQVFSISIQPISSNIESISSEININSLEIGEIVYDNFEITLNQSINQGEEIIFKYILNNGLYEEEILVSKIYGEPQIIFEDESENYNEYWTDNSDWSITYEEYSSPQSSITDSPYSNYSNNSEEIIELINSVDLSGFSYAEINFDAKWNIESGYDYVQLEISVDGGNSWIPQCGKYTNKGTETHDYALDEPLYDGNQSEWVNESVLLTDYLNQEISIRFKLYTDGGLRRDGFYYDNFEIKGLSGNLNLLDSYKIKSKLYPNPVDDLINIQSDNLIFKVEIYDILGKNILTIFDTNITIVKLPFLKSGIYLMKIYSDTNVENHRIIKN